MKHIEIESVSFNYPVGCDMQRANKSVCHCVDAFKQLDIDREQPIYLWCRGSSGAILATLFAIGIGNDYPNVFISHVKKEGEISHSNAYYVRSGNNVNIIIDDFVATGSTIKAILAEMKNKDAKPNILIVSTGALCYFKDEFDFIISNS